ncbi:MAG: GIY-YIG nuclease family protein [Candidatus Pacebacteria bacterium]|nr:GIY-YIG nuclease family protein [Candidatus Paceibacterota bacterium]
MFFPENIKLKKPLPDSPGVYLMKNKNGEIIYVGKATSLKKRVSSYFHKTHNSRLEKLVSEIFSIDFESVDSILEATILEAGLIKKIQPKFNIKEKSDKSWTYLAISKNKFPKLLLIRGLELKTEYQSSDFLEVFGPFTSKKNLETILNIIRKIFPWSNCEPNAKKPCFYFQIGRCPGICAGKISSSEYKKTINNIRLLFRGQKPALLKKLKKEMNFLSHREKFEEAASLRNKIKKLEHIEDVALLENEDFSDFSKKENKFFRLEGYDISNISGTSAVGSMVVFEDLKPAKKEYRKFKIRSLNQINDVGMISEVLSRRFNNPWPYPELILIDGGLGQVNAAKKVLNGLKINIPIVGIAKGKNRKNNRLVFGFSEKKLISEVSAIKKNLIFLRDEAHRFAISYHRRLRGWLNK